VRLRSNGREAPVLRRLTASYPRVGYLEYLPAVFQEDAESRRFLERFLAVFQSGFDDLDAKLDQVTDLFDPYRVPAKHLRWLAGLVALDVEPTWPEAQLREQIQAAVTGYRLRGTPAGLTGAIRTYAGVAAQVLEHFRLRRWIRLSQAAPLDGSAPLWSRDVYQRLQVTSYSQVGRFRLTSLPEPPVEAADWGANRFTVFFQTDPYRADEVRARVERIVEREKPAHTEAMLCPVLPRLRVGVQASLGVDAAVGSVSYLVLNRLATLSYDSILGCSREEATLRDMGSAVRPTLGVTTRLA
jgi:phage tail-like protein